MPDTWPGPVQDLDLKIMEFLVWIRNLELKTWIKNFHILMDSEPQHFKSSFSNMLLSM
jgi:hypothetical protein